LNSTFELQLLAMLDVAMAGRVAEELIFGADEITTGASSDLRQATRLAREMVTKYGFSDVVGLASAEYGEYGLSQDTRTRVEDEVKRLLSEANARATAMLKKHEKELHALAKTLLERETLTGAELRRLVKLPARSGDASFAEPEGPRSVAAKKANKKSGGWGTRAKSDDGEDDSQKSSKSSGSSSGGGAGESARGAAAAAAAAAATKSRAAAGAA
jgi:ATP-dependent metalloprotease